MQHLRIGRLRIVDLHGNTVRLNDLSDGGLWIRHGIQRLAAPSTGIENIQEHELALVAGSFEGSRIIMRPFNYAHAASLTDWVDDA